MFVSVDLPIPGEPPSRTSEPGTRPPPSTRSSSPMPVLRRGARSALTSRSGTRPRHAARRAGAQRGRPPLGARSSTSVFQSPHDGHCPCHLGVCAPHAEQENTEVGLGTCGG